MKMNMVYTVFLCFSCNSIVQAREIFNQTAGFGIEVSFETWSNFGEDGGCVSCPFTCVKPQEGPGGVAINFSDPAMMANLPSAFTTTQMNGCCFAPKSKTTQLPGCDQPANPVEAEDCGFTYGPSLEWTISSNTSPEDPMRAILFGSIDCTNFWAVGQTFVKQDRGDASNFITGSKAINGGCYGNPAGEAIVLAGCLTTTLKFDKNKGYTWEMLAEKCVGLSGQCSRTNGLWGQNLECCKDDVAIIGSAWDLSYEKYHVEVDTGSVLSGGAIFGVVFVGVAVLMCLVHNTRKLRDRARHTALLREQEANDDYDEIITPLTADYAPHGMHKNSTNVRLPADVDVSLHEGDLIYRPPDEELVFEGNM